MNSIKSAVILIVIIAITSVIYLFNFKPHLTIMSDSESNETISFLNKTLPLSPQQVTNPYRGAKKDITLKSADELTQMFSEKNYLLSRVKHTHQVPKLYVVNLPDNLNQQSIKYKVDDFIRLLLPNVLLVNQQVLAVRNTLYELKKIKYDVLTTKQQQWLKQLTIDYGLNNLDIKNDQFFNDKTKNSAIDRLLTFIDIIPISMVLAQGIDESGWGTGYFAIKGNNLYGEHLPAGGSHYLLTPNGQVKVAAFDSLYQATAAYFYNLNSSKAYEALRTLRASLRQKQQLTGIKLIQALSDYSVRGQAYVDNLQELIVSHQLAAYEHVNFDSSASAEIIRFTY